MEERPLADRVGDLEQFRVVQLRTFVVLALLSGGIALASLNRVQEEEIRASSFVVVDANGDERARLGLIGQGVAVYFREEEGGVRAGLGLATDDKASIPPGSPVLFLGDPTKPLAQLAVEKGPEGKARSALVLGDDSSVLVRLESGGDFASLGFMGFGQGGPWGVTPRVTLVAPMAADAQLVLRDPKGDVAFTTGK